jgi:antitoxin CptB
VTDASVLNRVRWRCRRGMLELDAWLAAFLDLGFPGLNAEDQAQFEVLLSAEDDDLYGWLTGRLEAPAEFAALLDLLKTTKVSI